jgi:hypothetical protein
MLVGRSLANLDKSLRLKHLDPGQSLSRNPNFHGGECQAG